MTEIAYPKAKVSESANGSRPRLVHASALWFALPLLALMAAGVWLVTSD